MHAIPVSLRAAALSLLVSGGLVACTNDCDRRCETELRCQDDDDPAALEECSILCEREVAKSRSVDVLGACVDCYEGKSCAELFPPGVEAGACFDVCRD